MGPQLAHPRLSGFRLALLLVTMSAASALLSATPVRADTCSEALSTCSEVDGAGCSIDCPSRCWSLPSECVWSGGVGLDSACSCTEFAPRCQRRAGQVMVGLFRAAAKVLARCEDAAAKQATASSCPDGRAADIISRAKSKAANKVNKACGTFLDVTPVVDPASTLMACAFGGDPAVSSVSDPRGKCRRGLGKASAKLADAIAKSLAKCTDALLVGRVAACPDTKTTARIAKQEQKFSARVAKVCPDLVSTGFGAVCPSVDCDTASAATATDSVAQVSQCVTCCAKAAAKTVVAEAFVVPGGFCGDAIVSGGEECDDGGESASCDVDCTLPECGDATFNASAGELCDSGGQSATCDADCTLPVCGDGIVNTAAGEQCDDGNTIDGDGCTSSCQFDAGVQNPLCPAAEEFVLAAGVGPSCTSDADCSVGTCDGGLGRCLTTTELLSGSSGLGHSDELSGGSVLRAKLACTGAGPPCGTCAVVGVDPAPGNCRCAGDNRIVCNEPLVADMDDCGGGLCECYTAPPSPLAAGGVPVCLVERLGADLSGQIDVDSGARTAELEVVRRSYLGESFVQPCPFCVGDTTAGDGLRDGTCVLGENAGMSCDVGAVHPSLPAPGGAGHSLDCFPFAAKNVSGIGTRSRLRQSTGALRLTAGLSCGLPPFISAECHCGECSVISGRGCASDLDCPGSDTCVLPGGLRLPNDCSSGTCSDLGNGRGECSGAGDTLAFCDGIVRANGDGLILCLTDLDCAASTIGVAAGACALSEQKRCFPDSIQVAGSADPTVPVIASLGCEAPTSNGAVNAVVGLPGPLRTLREGVSTLFCASDPAAVYTPGVGGCP